MAHNVLGCMNTDIVGSDPTRSTDVCQDFICYIVLCRYMHWDRSILRRWSLIQYRNDISERSATETDRGTKFVDPKSNNTKKKLTCRALNN